MNGSASSFLLEKSTANTSGIISPDFLTLTVSPTLISLNLIKSSLCKVALLTSVPEIKTVSKFATGVITPVLPTWNVIDLKIVLASSAGYLKAIHHLGHLTVYPILS